MNIIITGASSGVGYEAVLELLKDGGHRVIALARSGNKLQKLFDAASAINASDSLFILPFDIVKGDYEEVLIPFIKQKRTHVDILINNAGTLINKSFTELEADDFTAMFESNVTGHVRMIKAVLPLMTNGGHLVNIGSMGGYQGSIKFPGLAAYSASKAALHNLTECLALELLDQNIKVNCLALGSAQTEMLEEAFPEYTSPVSAQEMGKYVAEFAVSGHKYFNGKIIPVSVTTP